MTLETLQKEMISALKSGDKFRKDVLSLSLIHISEPTRRRGISY